MNRISIVLAAAALTGAAIAKPEPNAFLSRSANTHQALMAQVKSDAKVMSRFTRHFGMTSEQVVTYFSGLRAGTLEQDGVYLVYNADDQTDEIRAKVISYKKGTKVWEDANGQPILKMSCANPMVRGTDDLLAVVSPEVEANPVSELRSVEADPSPVSVVTPESQSEIFPTELEASAAALPITAAAPSIPAIAGSAARFNSALLLPLLGAAFVTQRGGNSGRNPVPEPTTLLVIGAGAALAAARSRRKA
jgi:hypothetical protein